MLNNETFAGSFIVADSSRGIYQFRHIAEQYGRELWLDDGVQIGAEDLAILLDPDHENHADVATELLDYGFVVDHATPSARWYFRTIPDHGDIWLVKETVVDAWDRENRDA